jgi:hypothetical protein
MSGPAGRILVNRSSSPNLLDGSLGRAYRGAADVVRVALLDDGTTGAFFLSAGRDDDKPTNVQKIADGGSRFGVLLIGMLMDLLDATVGNLALPVVQRDTGAPTASGWRRTPTSCPPATPRRLSTALLPRMGSPAPCGGWPADQWRCAGLRVARLGPRADRPDPAGASCEATVPDVTVTCGGRARKNVGP